LKNPITSSGIETATFRLQKKYATAYPSRGRWEDNIKIDLKRKGCVWCELDSVGSG
jgi:hypothetical protein